eukprot:13623113-Alexandrium_andersonii.AAC.1
MHSHAVEHSITAQPFGLKDEAARPQSERLGFESRAPAAHRARTGGLAGLPPWPAARSAEGGGVAAAEPSTPSRGGR